MCKGVGVESGQGQQRRKPSMALCGRDGALAADAIEAMPPPPLAGACTACTADTPALRHYSYNYKFYGAVPGAQLVIRMVSEINK